MCNAVIELEVLYRLPIPWSLRNHHSNAEQPVDLPPNAQVLLLVSRMTCAFPGSKLRAGVPRLACYTVGGCEPCYWRSALRAVGSDSCFALSR